MKIILKYFHYRIRKSHKRSTNTTMIKKTCLLLLLTLAFSAYSQDSKNKDEQKVKNVIDQFFESLKTRDTVLFKQTTMVESQIWRRRNNKTPVEVDMRFTKDDIVQMPMDPEINEIPLSFDISVGDGIAIAWVPYKLWVEDEYSHCGIDVFTLFEINGKWKIISAAYTIENMNCDKL